MRQATPLPPQLYYLGASFLLLLFYLPLISDTFAFHNDWIALRQGAVRQVHLESEHLRAIGRPLGALLLNVTDMYFYSTARHFFRDILLARFVSLSFLLGIQAYFMLRLHALGTIAPARLALMSILLFILPAYRLNVLWQTNFVPGILACYGAIGAFECFYRGTLTALRSKRLPRFGLALLLLLATHLVYTPSASLFLVFLLAVGLAAPARDWLAIHGWKGLGLFLLGTGAYFVYLKTGLALPDNPTQRGYTLALASNLTALLETAASLFGYCQSLWFPTKVPVFWVVATALMAWAWRKTPPARRPRRQTVLFTLAVLTVIALPNVLSQTKWSVNFRSTAALQSALAILFWGALRSLTDQAKQPERARLFVAYGCVPILVVYAFVSAQQAIRNQQEQYNAFRQIVFASASGRDARLCPDTAYLHYDEHAGVTLVDDTMLPIDFSYPAFYFQGVVRNMLECAETQQHPAQAVHVRFDCRNGSRPLAINLTRFCPECPYSSPRQRH